jgi:hypothetical protein
VNDDEVVEAAKEWLVGGEGAAERSKHRLLLTRESDLEEHSRRRLVSVAVTSDREISSVLLGESVLPWLVFELVHR